MKFKVFLVICFSFLIILLAGLYLQYKTLISSKSYDDVHYHAGFSIYVNGSLQNYDDIKFMHLNPCTPQDSHNENLQEMPLKERVHLHNNMGNVVHVHDNNVTWLDLFKSLELEYLLNDSTVQVFANSNLQVSKSLNDVIQNYESVVILINTSLNDLPENAFVPKQRILQAEASVENCGK